MESQLIPFFCWTSQLTEIAIQTLWPLLLLPSELPIEEKGRRIGLFAKLSVITHPHSANCSTHEDIFSFGGKRGNSCRGTFTGWGHWMIWCDLCKQWSRPIPTQECIGKILFTTILSKVSRAEVSNSMLARLSLTNLQANISLSIIHFIPSGSTVIAKLAVITHPHSANCSTNKDAFSLGEKWAKQLSRHFHWMRALNDLIWSCFATIHWFSWVRWSKASTNLLILLNSLLENR
jgi:hypothetical protein